MQIQTQAIVISSLKYGDNSKIIKCFTQNNGIASFIIKNVNSKTNKLNPLLSPLNQLEIHYLDKNSTGLILLRNCNLSHHYQTLYTDPSKISIVLFLAEILNQVLKEESANEDLFNYLSNSLITFDYKSEEYSDFHLWFLLNLTRFLGFFPQIQADAKFFDLANGISSNQMISGFTIENEKLDWLKQLAQIKFTENYQSIFNRHKRRTLLEILLRYYELHISDFRHPNSLEVLHQVFE